MDVEVCLHAPIDALDEADELFGAMPAQWHSPLTRPVFTSSAANSVVVPLRLSSWVIVAARPFFFKGKARLRAIQRLNLGLLRSAIIASSIARFAGLT